MSLFKDALATALRNTHQTASQFAEKTGLNRSLISNFITGPYLPRDETMVKMCDALPTAEANTLAKAWIYERLTAKYASRILATADATGSPMDVLLDALPQDAQEAFLILISTARDDEDFRASMVRLAAFLRPEKQTSQSTKPLAQDAGSGGISRTSHPTPTATAKTVKFPRQHIENIAAETNDTLPLPPRTDVTYTSPKKKRA